MNDFGLDQETVNGFLDEAGKHIATLNERLLGVEQGRSGSEVMAEMFRAAHSLKGAAAFLKLTEIAGVTHRMESVLDQVRHGRLGFSSQVVEALFQSFDLVSSLLAGVAAGSGGAVDTVPVMSQLDAVLSGAPVPAEARTQAQAATPTPTPPSMAAAAADPDPIEGHLGVLPAWLRGQLDEEDACEALVAQAAGEQPVALRFAGEDLLRFSRGTQAVLDTLSVRLRVRRILHLVEGPEDLWAPLAEYRLAIGVFAFCPGDAAELLPGLELAPGQAWLLRPGGAPPAELAIGRDPAMAATRHERLIVKPDMERHRALWLSTTRECLSEMDAALLDLERAPADAGHVDRLFRHLHSFKGASASMGLDEMARLAHQGENLLATIRDGRLVLDGRAIAGLFATKDALQACTERVERGEVESPDCTALDQAMAQVLGHGAQRRPTLPAWSPSEAELAQARATADDRQVWKLRLALNPQAPLADLRYGMILTNLGRIATIVAAHPSLTELERGLPDPPPLCALFASQANLRDLIDAITCDHILDWSIDPVPVESARTQPSADTRATPGGSAGSATASDTVRVDTARLDHLLNTAGELVITKARLTQQIDTLVRLLGRIDVRALEQTVSAAPRLAGGLAALRQAQEEIQRTRDTTMELHRHTSAMQNSVMQARMVPIGPLFQRFHRLVRDLCKERGREARLVTAGETTELDKKLIDEIGDPLTHLIRNGVDHGLESPDDRQAAGKPRAGTVRLEAFHQGGMICIQVGDDGRGLAVDRIRTKAIERGLVTAEAAGRLSPAEIFQFIFLPGFSTAAQVTNISGRGVGMDIVKSKVTALKGKIDIVSEPGQGASFTISLPLTLAMIDSLLVRIGGARFAFPLDGVREIVEVPKSEVRSVEGRGRVIFLREQVISVLDLHQVLGVGKLTGSGDVVRAVITKGGAETLAIAVDQVLGDEEIVVKPLGEEFARVRGLSGATVLGDGGVALILDLHGIQDMSRQRQPLQHQMGGRP